MTGPWNYSCKALLKSKECVIAVPTAGMSKTVASVGSCSGADVDKFKKIILTPLEAKYVGAPLIKECYANIECRVADYIKKHGIFIVDAVEAWVDTQQKDRRFLHAVGDGRFIVDGEKSATGGSCRRNCPKGYKVSWQNRGKKTQNTRFLTCIYPYIFFISCINCLINIISIYFIPCIGN
jgi:hypothetical protein